MEVRSGEGEAGGSPTLQLYQNIGHTINISFSHRHIYPVLILLPLVIQSFFRHIMRYAVSSPKFLNIMALVPKCVTAELHR